MGENDSLITEDKIDFNSGKIIRLTSQHDREIRNIKNRLTKLENMVGDSDKFAHSLYEAHEKTKLIDKTVVDIIEEDDTHKSKRTFQSIGKWAVVAIAGAIIGGFATLGLAIPGYQSQLQSLQNQIEAMRNTP